MYQPVSFSVLFLAIAVLLLWLYLFFAHADFWRPEALTIIPAANAGRKVAVIIPARNEADVIAEAVSSLLAQNFSGDLKLFLVDDNSTDDTVQRAGTHEQLTIVHGASLPPGWSGKVWAMHQGWQAVRASGFAPDYLLLTDADIVHSPHSVAQLIAQANASAYDLTSLMVRLHCETLAEKLLIPAFVYFFFLLYPPKRVADPRSKTAGAAGGCILIKPDALQRAGDFEAIRNEIIDDCALARRVKQSGSKLWLGLAAETRSIRPYDGYPGIRDMIARTAFNQLGHSWLLLLGCILGMALIFLAPLAILPTHPAYALSACALMFLSYLPITRYYRLPLAYVFTLPFAACFYLYATVLSALRYGRGAGGQWKGRAQDA